MRQILQLQATAIGQCVRVFAPGSVPDEKLSACADIAPASAPLGIAVLMLQDMIQKAEQTVISKAAILHLQNELVDSGMAWTGAG